MKLWAVLLTLGISVSVNAHAGSLRSCDVDKEPSPAEQDLVLRFTALIKQELQDSGADVALVSRSGLDLALLHQRYSHAGVALRDSANGPWSVRQLYYACDEGKPRIFDQGMSGFVMGLHDMGEGFVSVVLLPSPALHDAAIDDHRALALLNTSYSANAYAFALTYQNCNQWLAELMASAWGDADSRAAAQAWLQAVGYEPTEIALWRPFTWLTALSPYLHNDDRVPDDIEHGRYRVSLPASLEAFARAQVPHAQRIEFCHRGPDVVIHRGWEPMAEDCVAGPGDESRRLE
ncbi:MAG TPA: DUF2145 domain-containing protein [Burkholderiaceae bacterium]